jgi:hypothetical protein
MRVRRAGRVCLIMMIAASLAPTSMYLASAHLRPAATLNLNIRSSAPIDGDTAMLGFDSNLVWAVPAPDSASSRLGTASRSTDAGPRIHPDGLWFTTVTVIVGAAHPAPMFTNAVTIPQLLLAMDVKLGDMDLVRPSLDGVLFPDLRVRVIRVTQAVETLTEATPSPTLIQYSSDLPIGTTRITKAGLAGQAIRTYRITYRNGKEWSRELLAEQVVSAPAARIEIRGTKLVGGTQTGQASWYDCTGNFAAHLSLPKGTVVKVTDLDNGKTITVVNNDRGPYGVPGRIIDLCAPAFAQLAPLGQGVANVQLSW